MIQYVLELLVFQLVFLLVYDLFLKKETFFQGNRVYLLVTSLLSLVLPWIKLEALKTTLTSAYAFTPQNLFQLDIITLEPTNKTIPFWTLLNWHEWLFILGTLVASFIFCFKLLKIQGLKYQGKKEYYKSFTKVIVTQSELAFSFFKHVFLGDEIPKEKEANILAHEMVHIKQWHSLDLLFFELMRIVFWFNPMVYVYQSRMSELHEFIADAHVAKTNKKEQYQLLLAEVFQTQHVSFVNQFFKSSLIKKRIVMLSKTKSKKVFQLKYLLLLPLVFGMLFYSSCEMQKNREEQNSDVELVRVVSSDSVIPFAEVDEVPIFPGCENAIDKKACFQESIQTHIRKHFNYPLEAQDLGIQGRVNVMFQIAGDGSIINIKKRGPHQLLEDEVERIINRLPKMQPGKQAGKVVSVPFSIPITFKLDNGKDSNLSKKK